MTAISVSCKITSKTEIYPGLFDILIESPEMAKNALPGQFVMVGCGEGLLLRRPISIADAFDGCLRLIFEVRGKGTQWLGKRRQGEPLEVLGTLGAGYPACDSTDKPILFVGGGIGVPPLLYTVKKYGNPADVILGFRNKELMMLEEDFGKYARSVTVCTDDGSCGVKGFVTGSAGEKLKREEYAAIFACGPKPMLKGLTQLAREQGVKCYISLEERMGCGLGVCLACAVKVEKDGGQDYAHVCKHGPVFEANEVIFDD